jgi:hypothetical protein
MPSVAEPGGRRVGAFGDAGSGQQVGDEVRDEQRDLGLAQSLLGGVLVQGVEGQELEAVAAIELLERHAAVDGVDAARRALVAIVEGLP